MEGVLDCKIDGRFGDLGMWRSERFTDHHHATVRRSEDVGETLLHSTGLRSEWRGMLCCAIQYSTVQ